MSQDAANHYRLRRIADELRATFAAEGYTVDQGLDANDAFRDGNAVRSSMIRKLAYRAVARGADAAGLDCVSVAGGGREVECYVGNVLRHYRVLRLTDVDEDGNPRLLASSPAILEFAGDTFWREERHALAYSVTELNTIDSVFVARVLDTRGEKPAELVLGPILGLDPLLSGPSGFQPADEDLDGFDEDEEPADDGS